MLRQEIVGSLGQTKKYLLGLDIKLKVFSRGEKLMAPSKYTRFINFLQEDLAISTAEVAVALRHREQDPGPLPMILWQYGLVTLEQLDRIYDWLEAA